MYGQKKEDAKNLSVIVGSAMLAGLVTTGFLFSQAVRRDVAPTVRVVTSTQPRSYESLTPLSGTNRLYGRVHTRDGERYEGFIRWDRNEGSWTDVLDANKEGARGRVTQSGIRFGHVQRIEARGSREALFILRSGETVRMNARATDLGSGLRALIVDDPNHGQSELDWDDLDAVEFLAVPDGSKPAEGRMHGTMVTRSGMEFTGYVTWDVDEIYSSDVLDGDEDGIRRKVPFGAIGKIERYGSRAARVTLHSGDVMVLDGTNDVNRSNSGISVSDPGLGQVKIDWDELEEVRFHGAETEAEHVQFDGGTALEGTVVTEAGRELTGRVLWDMDEASTWEMLNGEDDGVAFQVEFGNIARIEKTRAGARVTLKDGRSFDLHGSNDVDDGNRGIAVETEDGSWRLDWDDFRELRLND